ncbi:MAG TPA: VWA domain-containing protein [Bryobacteraceae bacterium]|nr:VWA domain-containing protein [Bryobacteraceae bacterium]
MHQWHLRNRNSRIGLAALILVLAPGLRAQAPEAEVRARESAPPFQITVETNLVTVRVVVRDRQGRPVGGLTKDDFRLFDDGKPRPISGFAVEVGAAPAPTGGAPPAGTGSAHAIAAPFPERFVTLFFDDLHLEDGAVKQVRNAAWRYISTALRPQDRVGIVTSSGQTGTDFTADRNRLHDVLFKIAGHSRTLPTSHECPKIGEYQAYLMDQLLRSDAIEIAAAEGWECRCKGLNETAECADGERRMAIAQAAQIWDLADTQSLHALDLADAVVQRMSAMPGQRILVLVSAGFLTTTRGTMIDALIDHALRQNVVVNAIDAAGLYTRDAQDSILVYRHDLQNTKNQIENEGVSLQRDVLAAVAAGTGGTFFQNDNDFDAGIRETAQAPEIAYILSFALSDVKLNGRFHSLKVRLDKGGPFDIQARRGYFASAPAEAKAPAKSAIESLVFSQEQQQDFPATVTARTGASGLLIVIHVDIQPLRFRKEGDRNLDTLTFDTAVFDSDGKYVAGKESSLDFRLPGEKLQQLRQSGINAETRFRVPAGAYRIREVVRDTETGKTTTVNANVQVE